MDDDDKGPCPHCGNQIHPTVCDGIGCDGWGCDCGWGCDIQLLGVDSRCFRTHPRPPVSLWSFDD